MYDDTTDSRVDQTFLRSRCRCILVPPMAASFTLNPVQGFALSGLGVAMGLGLKRVLPVLDRLNIPASIAGGLVLALVRLVLHDRWVNVEVDATFLNILLLATYAVIGLNSSVSVMRHGGVKALLVTALATIGGVIQGLIGILLATGFRLDPRIGVLAGTVALAGGPSNALAYGPVFEKMGVSGGTALALASATFGITVAGLVAGSTGGLLIRRWRLIPSAESSAPAHYQQKSGSATLLIHAILVAVALGIGNLISLGLDRSGAVVPGFAGCIFAGILIRNVDDSTNWASIDPKMLEQMLAAVLPIFISMAMLNLKLWELAAIALPLLAILVIEIALTWLLSYFIAFRVLGRDYEAAVMTAGFCGFMVGIVPNAIASMQELTAKSGPAPRALFVTPLGGSVMLNPPLVLTMSAFIYYFR